MSKRSLVWVLVLLVSFSLAGCFSQKEPVPVIVDEHGDLTMVFEATPNIDVTTSNPNRYAGDDNRLYKLDHEEAYVVYQVPGFPDGNFTGFEVVTWYNKDFDVAYPGDMSFAVSSDNIQYTVLSNVTKESQSVSGTTWLKVVWSCHNLPAETKYLKIIFGDTSQNRAAWMIQIGRTTLYYAITEN